MLEERSPCKSNVQELGKSVSGRFWLTRLTEVHSEVVRVVGDGRGDSTEDVVLKGLVEPVHNVAHLENFSVASGLLPVPERRGNSAGRESAGIILEPGSVCSLGKIVILDGERRSKKQFQGLHFGLISVWVEEKAVDVFGNLVQGETAARVLSVGIDALSDGVVVVPVLLVGLDYGAAEIVGMEHARVEVLDPAPDRC